MSRDAGPGRGPSPQAATAAGTGAPPPPDPAGPAVEAAAPPLAAAPAPPGSSQPLAAAPAPPSSPPLAAALAPGSPPGPALGSPHHHARLSPAGPASDGGEAVQALVIGAGPAGLMAAETLSAAGVAVLLVDAMPTPARKFLMAGKSGLNLTRDEPAAVFAARIASGGSSRTPGPVADPLAGPVAGPAQDDPPGGETLQPPMHPDTHPAPLADPEPMADPAPTLGLETLRRMVEGFGPPETAAWAEGLGAALFTGSTGRVFPVGMKASPLLRAWLARLAAQGVALRMRWRWLGWDGEAAVFGTPEGPRRVLAGVTVLALGGASWPRLGSDASWTGTLTAASVPVTPLRPANMGFRVDWSPRMADQLGRAVKGAALTAGGLRSRGEWLLTRTGIEGGGVYEIAAALRDGAAGTVDLAPDLDHAALTARLSPRRGAKPGARLSIGNRLRRALGDPVRAALALEWGQPLPADTGALAARLKALPIRHAGPAGIERAISSAGGIALEGLSPTLELRARPGVWAAGEMLDWEAPTGGYLLTACLATGRAAGTAALRHLSAGGKGNEPPGSQG